MTFKKIAVIFCSSIAMACVLEACSTDSSENLSYESNSFYTFEARAPKHPPKKARVDFFNKVCEPGSGGSYECRYSE